MSFNESIIYLAFICVFLTAPSSAQDISDTKKAVIIQEHTLDGMPDCNVDNLYYRTAYILCFNPERKVPNWTAYKVVADFRNTPKREGRLSRFRNDPDIDGEAKDADYKGYFNSRGYARGHYTPYGVLGGDRDHDGELPNLEASLSDPDDEKTVFEGNYMSNIAPQHHNGFNGSPGMWWKLERWLQDKIITADNETAHVIAGAIFGPGDVEKIGPNKDIHVPPMFYKIIVINKKANKPQRTLAFLFPHHRKAHQGIHNYLTSIDVVEAMTGIDFFKDTVVDEDIDTLETWQEHFQD
ncbi:DNA/RNA non-specific endonuclease [Kordiimonas aquimaris]|uniref:DNA/RNA non-specific endonuclease n=1 Tax=Kordiimonas aquimaris TaxID=707591 RepID=UPI0021D22279|nr:DNA/RNA non-specific endonuclease [Kordiimonas aquimaris]